MSNADIPRCHPYRIADLSYMLAVQATRLPWSSSNAVVLHKLAYLARPAEPNVGANLVGAYDGKFGSGVCAAGRPRLPLCLMVFLPNLMNCFNLSDEKLVECSAKNVSIDAIANRVDGRLLEIGRRNVVCSSRCVVVVLKQTNALKRKTLCRRASGYARANQFKRLRGTVRRQRTALGVAMREVQRKLDANHRAVAAGRAPAFESSGPKAPNIAGLLERVEHVRDQRRHTKHKLYALRTPEAG